MISWLALLAAPAWAQFTANEDITHVDQRLILGVPERDVEALVDDILARNDQAVHAMDVYRTEQGHYYNFILGPRDRGWWMGHRIAGESYPEFLAEMEAEGWCVVSSEPVFLDGSIRFGVLLTKKDCRPQMRFVHVKPEEGAGVFRRDFSTQGAGLWAAQTPSGDIGSNRPRDLPAGYRLTSLRVLASGRADYSAVIYEQTGAAEVSYIAMRDFNSFRDWVQRQGAQGRWIVDFEVTTELTLAGRIPRYQAISAPVTGPIGLIFPGTADKIRADLRGRQTDRIVHVTAFEDRDGTHIYWLQLAPR